MKNCLAPRAMASASAFVWASILGSAHAQNTSQSSAPPARPAADQRPDERSTGPLAAEQVAKVKAVLSAYKPASFNADEAKAIKRALRDAGLRHNAALDKAITDAGFSPQKLEELDPRPPRSDRPPGEGLPPANSPTRKP